MSNNNQQRRKIALERYKNHRKEGRSALDEDDDNDDNDGQLFDYMSEKEYAAVVEARREREDFVVNDDGLGYYDDGEEHYGGEAEEEDDIEGGSHKKRKGSTTTAALTAQALKKARKNQKAAATAAARNHGGGDDDDGTRKTKRDGSMWDFLNKGPSTVAVTSNSVTTSQRSSNNKSHSKTSTWRRAQFGIGGGGIPNVDDLLKELDHPSAVSSSSSMVGQSSGRPSYGYGRSRARYNHGNTHGHTTPTTPSSSYHHRRSSLLQASPRSQDMRDHDKYQYNNNNDDDNNDGDNNEFPVPDHDDDDGNDHGYNASSNDPAPSPPATTALTTNVSLDTPAVSTTDPGAAVTPGTKSVSFASELVKSQTSSPSHQKSSDPDAVVSLGATTTEGEMTPSDKSRSAPQGTSPDSTAEVPAVRRPRRNRRLGKLSGAAQKALEEEQERKERQKQQEEQQTQAPNAKPLPVGTTAPATLHTAGSSMIVQPSQIANATGTTTTAGQVALDQILMVKEEPTPTKNEDKGSEMATTLETTTTTYVDMFWTDITERNGDILLFGKVPLKKNSNKNSKDNSDVFVSAMLWVTGHKRNLFVLPKPDAVMTDVHQEINDILHTKGAILPHLAGVSWAGKVVQRNYAFEDPNIPRDASTQYLKVVYDAKYPVPSETICEEGGRHFSRILGAGASNIENFIIKRKLKGPSWIRISHPLPCTRGGISHTKLELQVDSPKYIVPLSDEDGANGRRPPPMVTMSLKLKTVVNPGTHKSEVVSVSAICHRHVPLDTATSDNELSTRHMTQISLIRPLTNHRGIGTPNFPPHFDREIAAKMPELRTEVNERALLSRLFLQIGQWDPDVIVGHNAWGYDIEVLLSRAGELKIHSAWSKLGRRKRTEHVNRSYLSSRRDMYIAEVMQGRLLCDTYLSAKELLNNETTYSLSNLAATCLKTNRAEIEPVDIPNYYSSADKLVYLAHTTLVDAQLVQRLLFKLQALPLTAQLTCIAGNLWSHTMRSNRAERTEYLLLHEFHQRKYLVPEKPRLQRKQQQHEQSSTSKKAKYSGGLVLDPKRGFYDSFILLLDFNSLYPSLIQEYNLCFTTIEKWAEFAAAGDDAADDKTAAPALPPLPDSSSEVGVLPKVIKSLVERRRVVKRLLKQENRSDKKAELDVRQKALKLTANSMYGCLGFSNSRFFAQPIAAMVTAMGRETLQKTVDIAQNNIGLDVIYGDTDSIMINTRINDAKDVTEVTRLGERVKKEVNKLYRTLELEIDGIFRSMLLLKKKKYAAKTVELGKDGTITRYGQELKGLDLVRRDWCVQSKETGRYVTEQILSGKDSETIVTEIYNHLEELGNKMRKGELPLEKYTITKGLSKHPKDYPDAKSQPHVQVAKMLLQENRPVNTGDHIPYIITAPLSSDGPENERNVKKEPSATERARHPEEVLRSQGKLKPDVLWYLTQQILPPLNRLCEPIEAISAKLMAEKLGLDSSNIRDSSSGGDRDNEDEVLIEYKPASLDSDEERFKEVEKLQVYCMSCQSHQEFPGVVRFMAGDTTIMSGLFCTNKDCPNPYLWGHADHYQCFARLQNTMKIWLYKLLNRYYEGTMQCNEPSCQLVTRQVSVAGAVCLRRGCTGRLVPQTTSRDVHAHLKYLEMLFDIQHCQEQLLTHNTAFKQYQVDRQKRFDLAKELPTHDKTVFHALHKEASHVLQSNDYNWISSSFWSGLFQKSTMTATKAMQ